MLGASLDQRTNLLEGVVMKWALWVGTPSLIAFLAWVYSHFLENIHFLFLLAVGALLVAILPRLSEAKARRR
jgi:hypothetical protein